MLYEKILVFYMTFSIILDKQSLCFMCACCRRSKGLHANFTEKYQLTMISSAKGTITLHESIIYLTDWVLQEHYVLIF